MKAVLERASERGHARYEWLNTYYSFSFAEYYNPQRMGFGALRVLNDDTIAPAGGFDMHPHRNMEVVTIPIRGAIHHRDSEGHEDSIRWGQIQVMSAGSGLYHSEFNDESDQESTEMLQIWVIPNKKHTQPTYATYDISDILMSNQFATIIAPDGSAPAKILQDAWFSIGELSAGAKLDYQLHDADNGVYVFMIAGQVDVANKYELYAKDGLGIWDTEAVSFESVLDSTVLLIEVPMI